jgi:protein-tyrosine phosphatase
MAGLDYSNPQLAVNFRDVGLFVNMMAGRSLLPENRLFRGGTVKWLTSPSAIGNPRTILNLQRGPDPVFESVRQLHFPTANTMEVYETADSRVRTWLRHVIRALISPAIVFPLYVHCLSGRDRTGVVIAAILKVLEFDDDLIVEEFSLSEGTEHKVVALRNALVGLGDVTHYFRGLDLRLVEQRLRAPHPPISPTFD